jgi:hypothetical protein
MDLKNKILISSFFLGAGSLLYYLFKKNTNPTNPTNPT